MDKKIVAEIICPICTDVFKTKCTLTKHLIIKHSYDKESAKSYSKSLGVITETELNATNTAKHTFIRKYGVSNPLKSSDIKDKVKNTNKARYGCEWGLSSKDIQKRITKTNIKLYGGNRPACDSSIVDKQRNTSIIKYGKWYSQTDDHHKSNYQYKNYEFPSGKKIRCQGYEPLAIDVLLMNYNENDILVDISSISNIACEIWYIHEGKKRRYFPDIYIPSRKLFIEVKSIYTHSQNKIVNELKRQRCIELGYGFEFWVFDKKAELVVIA